MNFRECRQAALFEIFQYLDPDISPKKNFLICGGMRNAYYLLTYHKVKIFGLCGCGEINVPGVFEIFDMKYSTIPANIFWDYFKNDQDKDDYFYVFPAVRAVLNVEDIDLEHYNLVGHSYFLVDRIEGERLYLRTINHNVPEDQKVVYYVTHNVYNKINNKSEWIKEADFEIYQIKKTDLHNSKVLAELLSKTEKELLKENIKTFLDNETYVGEQDETVRYEGEQVYEAVAKHIAGMIDYLKKTVGTQKCENFKNYIYLQLVNFRKLLVAGTDGYYRTEFCNILEDYEEFTDDVERWNDIIALWRKFGRVLSMSEKKEYFMEHTEEILERLLSVWNEIVKAEVESIKMLQEKIAEK